MKNFVFILFIVVSSPAAYADGPGDFLQKSLIGGELHFMSNTIKSVSIDCSSILIYADNPQAIIPVNSVNTIFYNSDAVGFACISGGGCIQSIDRAGVRTGVNEITISRLVAPGLRESIAKAFKLHQKSCGGPIKRPY